MTLWRLWFIVRVSAKIIAAKVRNYGKGKATSKP
jgi:hypothetical protein